MNTMEFFAIFVVITNCFSQMRIKHSEPTIESSSPYKNSKTGRKEVGESLTQIVDSTTLGCTIALTGEWGSGKTTFLKMWRQDLDNLGFPTVMLNAWKTEWAEDPLIAVIACIQKACEGHESQENINTVREIARQFRKNPLSLIWAIARTVLNTTAGVDLSDVGQELIDLSDRAFDEAVEEFDAKERSIEELKKALEKMAWKKNQGSENGRPLVFIIDELDRCKPDYAVRLLEVLKHFFEVKNIVFVCAVDKKHLENSICGFYGSERINASEYLRRFFDLEVELPAPDYEMFSTHLYQYYQLGAFFDSEERKGNHPREQGEEFQRFLASLARKGHLSLRQMEQICAFTKLSLQRQNVNAYYYPSLSLFITYLRFFDQPFYQILQTHGISAQDLLDRIISDYGGLIDKDDNYGDKNNRQVMLDMIGRLIVSYNNDRGHDSESIYDSATKTTHLNNPFFTQDDLNSTIGWLCSSHPAYRLEWLFHMLNLLRIEA